MIVTNLTIGKINRRVLEAVFEAANDVFGEKLGEISLVLVGDKKMREINKKYRANDAVTDVLSFEGLNEVYICLPQAKRQSRLLKTSLNTELTRLLAHGIVHLKGYDHERGAKEARRMEKMEDKIFKSL